VSDAPRKLTYASAGVDIDAADDSKHRIKRLVESTFTAGARGAFGGFGGMFRVPEGARLRDRPRPVGRSASGQRRPS